jgi:hypothetical protein
MYCCQQMYYKCVISSILLAGYLTVFVSNIVQIRLCHHLAVYITVFTAHTHIYIYIVSTHMYTLYIYTCKTRLEDYYLSPQLYVSYILLWHCFRGFVFIARVSGYPNYPIDRNSFLVLPTKLSI